MSVVKFLTSKILGSKEGYKILLIVAPLISYAYCE
jgi:hypothetical protein